jgi:hypothetical protein
LYGFPHDGTDPWAKTRLEELKQWLEADHIACAKLLALSSSQLEAKKILEEAGFKVLGMVPSSHLTPEEIAKWKSPADGRTVYLMGKGFFQERGTRGVRTKRIRKSTR